MIERCYMCGMSFKVEKPRAYTETTTCAERGCNRRFWHHYHRENFNIVVGMYPEEAKPLLEQP